MNLFLFYWRLVWENNGMDSGRSLRSRAGSGGGGQEQGVGRFGVQGKMNMPLSDFGY